MTCIHSRILYGYSLLLAVFLIAKRALLFRAGYRGITYLVVFVFVFVLLSLYLLLAVSAQSLVAALLQSALLLITFKFRKSSKINLRILLLVTCISTAVSFYSFRSL